MTKNSRIHVFAEKYGGDVAALAVLVIGIWLAGGFLLRDDLFIYGDHPGHYWLTWFTLNEALPQQQLAAWMPFWYAGYPELQFYPPGFALVAWLIRSLSLEQLSIQFAYEATVFLAYSLPSLTIYYALRHLRFQIPTALVGGMFGLIFPAIFGGAGAPFIGMIGSRLAFALNPLVLVWLMDVAHGRGKRYWFLAVAALATAILLHPYHEIGILIAVALYVLIARLNLVRAGSAIASVVVCAVLLDAFWIVPLFAYASTEMIPILRTTFDQTWRHLISEELYPYALLALAALLELRRTADKTQRAFILTLVVLVPVLAISMLAIHVVLIERLQIYQIDPVRLIGEYYLALVLLAAVGLGGLAERARAWLGNRRWSKQIVSAAVVGIVCVWFVSCFYQAHRYYFPSEADEPRFLSGARSEYALDEFWQVLSETEGRVWFTSFYQHLNKRASEPLATTLPALTPLYSGREIIGGTYSRWSPVAALMWVGETSPPALRGLVEETDDRALFGTPIEAVTVEQLDEWARRFNVTTVVASVDDFQTRSLLDTAPNLQSYYNNGLFFAYRMLDYRSKWVEGTRANIDNVVYQGSSIAFHVRLANANGRAHVKVYAAPLWQARTQDGTVLPIRRDEFGLIEIPLPRGRDYTVTVSYAPGPVERTGAIVSAVTLVALVGGAAVLLFRRSRRAPAVSGQPMPGTLTPDSPQ